jgi:hypothetical protein
MKVFACLLVLALCLCVATSVSAQIFPNYYDEQYEMNAACDTLAGTVNGNVMTADGGGAGTYGASGFMFANGIGTFLDDASSSGYQGFRLNNAAGLLGTDGYTVDLKIRWLAGCEGNGSQKSMGFAGNNGCGRGLRVDGNMLGYVSNSLLVAGDIDNTVWQRLRIVVQNDGSQGVYRWVNGSYYLVIEVINPGPVGVSPAITAGPGFFLGSWGGTSTTLSSFQLDYVRVKRGTGLYEIYETVPTPEPGSLLALAGGLFAMAGLAVRGRRG